MQGWSSSMWVSRHQACQRAAPHSDGPSHQPLTGFCVQMMPTSLVQCSPLTRLSVDAQRASQQPRDIAEQISGRAGPVEHPRDQGVHLDSKVLFFYPTSSPSSSRTYSSCSHLLLGYPTICQHFLDVGSTLSLKWASLSIRMRIRL